MPAGVSFLDTVDAVAVEIEERLPGYFDRQPLRCVAPEELCRRIAAAWNLPLVGVADARTFNAVDRHLHHLLAGVEIGASADLVQFREQRNRARAAARARIATLPERFEQGRAGAVRYAAIGGGGPPLICINALGQTLAPWLPLIDLLSVSRRVVVWDPPAADAAGRAITFAEHCRDLQTIVEAEGGECHLAGWCTGAKLAARYARTNRDAVASMVLLGGSFKHPRRARELDTPYERNLEAMLQAVARQPVLAERLRGVFAPAGFAVADLDQLDGDALALRALTGLPAGLTTDVRRPFSDARTLATYAIQHVELWSHDETAAAAEVGTPVLGIAGEHDQIVSPAAFRDAVAAFPASRFEVIPATTHYCFYERPQAVAERIEEWLDCAKLRSGRASGHA